MSEEKKSTPVPLVFSAGALEFTLNPSSFATSGGSGQAPDKITVHGWTAAGDDAIGCANADDTAKRNKAENDDRYEDERRVA